MLLPFFLLDFFEYDQSNTETTVTGHKQFETYCSFFRTAFIFKTEKWRKVYLVSSKNVTKVNVQFQGRIYMCGRHIALVKYLHS